MKNRLPRIGVPQMNLARTKGFTLVELLVVITIIAVLAAVVLAVTQKIKEKAQITNAISSMRQVTIACTGYSAENSGDINVLRDTGDPLEGNNLKGIGDAWVKNTFWGRCQPYLFPEATMTNQKQLNTSLKQSIARLLVTSNVSTMANTALSGAPIYGDGSGLPVPFAFNLNRTVYQWGSAKKVSGVDDPSRIIHMTYGSYRFNKEDGKVYVPIPQKGTRPTCNIFFFRDQKAVAAFVDGHIESLSVPISDRKFD